MSDVAGADPRSRYRRDRPFGSTADRGSEHAGYPVMIVR
jgi:nucleotide-binding universal stress UspA family protein